MSDSGSTFEDGANKPEDEREELAENLAAIILGDESNETEIEMNEDSTETESFVNDESNEADNHLYDKSNLSELSDTKYFSLKKELDDIVQDFGELEILPDVVAEIVQKKKLNRMILDLYDYNIGFDVLFSEFDAETEIFHGRYSYGVSLIEYIRDGEIPYQLFDKLIAYNFKVYYDGYVFCQLRMHFKEGNMRSHFVLLKHTIQTITGECAMICEADKRLDFEIERARLINRFSPELCLNPDPVVAEIVIANELNQYPFIDCYLRHIIENEKARREKGVQLMDKKSVKDSEFKPTKQEDFMDWRFRLSEPSEEDAELAKVASKMEHKWTIVDYLKHRQMCFPDENSFTGFHVEIENFVYEYDGITFDKKVERVKDKLCIGVLNDKEFYYTALKLDKKITGNDYFYWKENGCREQIDSFVNAITKVTLGLSRGGMRITHNRFFGERVELSDGKIKIVREKLKNPVSRVLRDNLPSPESENEEPMKTDVQENSKAES